MAGEEITVFISYAHEDVELARAILDGLGAQGFSVWIDEGEMRSGDSLTQRIASAIHANEFVAALVSEDSVQSRWCNYELGLAITSGLNREGVKLLSMRVGDVEIPETLSDTFCPRIDPQNPAEGIEKLAADARSHHADREHARAAGRPLPTTGGEAISEVGTPTITLAASGEERVVEPEPIRIIGIIKEGMGQPRNDGTAGSALYEVPLRLSSVPSHEWAQAFTDCWNHPPSFSTMHRPGISSIYGDTLLLQATTIEEVASTHAQTLRLCVRQANEQEAARLERERQQAERDAAAREAHERHVDEIADTINFDDEP